MKHFNNNHGFSLIETVLGLCMGVAVLGITSSTMLNNFDAGTYITERKAEIGDARYAMSRITDELLHVETADISNIQATQISFVSQSGESTNFRLAANGSGMGLYRGNNLLVDKVASFGLTYYDADGNAVAADAAQIPNVRRIKVSLTTGDSGGESNLALSTTITPRIFVGYSSYQ